MKDFDDFNEGLHLDASYDNLLSLQQNDSSTDIRKNINNEKNEQNQGIDELNNEFIPFPDDSSDDDTHFGHDLSESSSEDNEDDDANIHRTSSNSQFPWILNNDHSKEIHVTDWLTKEIKDFVNYISPSQNEIHLRNETIKNLKQCVKDLWLDSELHVFGSFATDLYLPGSDIDCSVISTSGDKENRQYLYDLAKHLKYNGIATKTEVVAHTRVPIIKFVDRNSNLNIDVSFERTNGIEAAKLIRDWIDATPGLRELVLIVKQFLSNRRLNDVYNGGLGGFSTICLVYSFLSLHPKIITKEINALDNLGVLLIEFFELYGKNFAYDQIALSFDNDIFQPVYLPKSHWKALTPSRNGSFFLAIQDPKEKSNNISKSSYNLGTIRKAFAGAFELLTSKCFELNRCTFKDRVGKSILGNVIKFKGEIREFKDDRSLVSNRAIVENERFHLKRKRVVMENTFLDPSDDELLTGGHVDSEIFKMDKSVAKLEKKRRKMLKKESAINLIKRKTLKELKKIDSKLLKEKSKKKERVSSIHDKKTQTVDNFMGIESDKESDSDSSNMIVNIVETPISSSRENSSIPTSVEPTSILRKTTVDAQTKRDYWLSKGKEISNAKAKD